MNQSNFIKVVSDLTVAFIKAGAKVTETKTETSFELGKYKVTLTKSLFNLGFMGQNVTQVEKGWPYYSVSFNLRTHRFEDKPTQQLIDHIARMVDGIKDEVFDFTMGNNDMTLISKLYNEASTSHRFKPRRESYISMKQIKNLLEQEVEYLSLKRRAYHKEVCDKYQPFLEIKNQLPHSLKQLKERDIQLTRISERYYRADLSISINGETIEVSAWEHDPYRTIRGLDDSLRSELTNFGKNIYMNNYLRPFDFLLSQPLDEIIKAS